MNANMQIPIKLHSQTNVSSLGSSCNAYAGSYHCSVHTRRLRFSFLISKTKLPVTELATCRVHMSHKYLCDFTCIYVICHMHLWNLVENIYVGNLRISLTHNAKTTYFYTTKVY